MSDEEARDLIMEAHYRAIGLWYRIGAAIGGFTVALGTGVVLVTGEGPKSGVDTQAVILGAMVLCCLAIGIFAMGQAVARYSNRGRVAAIVWTVLTLLAGLPRAPRPATGIRWGGDRRGQTIRRMGRCAGAGCRRARASGTLPWIPHPTRGEIPAWRPSAPRPPRRPGTSG